MILTKTLYGTEDLSVPFDLRQQVFTLEQGFPAEIDVDELDPVAIHTVVYVGGVPAGTARAFLTQLPGQYQIGRVCVLKPQRKLGLGKVLIDQLEFAAKVNGGTCVVLHAQCYAQGFYEKCGYHTVGEPFDEDGCPHITMEKNL